MDIIKRQGFLNILLIYAGVAVGVVNTFLRARVITPEEIGLISLLTTIAGVIEFFINFGLPPAITRYYARFREKLERKSSYLLFVFAVQASLLLVGCLLTLLARRYILALYKSEMLAGYFNYIFLFITADVLSLIFKQIVEAELKSVYANLANDFSWRIAQLVFLTLMLWLDIGFYYYFLFNIFIVFLRTALLVIPLHRRLSFRQVDFGFADRTFVSEFSHYCLFMTFAGAAGLINASIDKLLLGYFLDVGAVGIYTITRTLSVLVKYPGTGFVRIAAPMIANYWAKNDTAAIARLYKENTNIQLFISGFIYVFLLVFARPILALVGKPYISGQFVLIFLATGQLVNVGTGLCGTIIAYSQRYRFDLILQASLAALTVINGLIFIPPFGITGAAIGTAISLTLYNLTKLLFVRLKFGMLPYNLETVKVLLAGALSAAIFWAARRLFGLEGPLRIAAAALVVGILYLLFGGFVLRLSFVLDTYHSLAAGLRRAIARRTPPGSGREPQP